MGNYWRYKIEGSDIVRDLANKIGNLEEYIASLTSILNRIQSNMLSSSTNYLVGNMRNEITTAINDLNIVLGKIKTEYEYMEKNKKWGDGWDGSFKS